MIVFRYKEKTFTNRKLKNHLHKGISQKRRYTKREVDSIADRSYKSSI